jgi:hypothetical protein
MFDSTGRRIGVAIGIAVIVVVIAAVALASGGGDDGAPDRSTVVANRLCETARREIAEARKRYDSAFERGDTDQLARAMFDAVGRLQSKLATLDVPHESLEEAVELRNSVYEAEQPILDLITVPPKERIPEDAQELESLESEVHDVAVELGFEECERLSLEVPPPTS